LLTLLLSPVVVEGVADLVMSSFLNSFLSNGPEAHLFALWDSVICFVALVLRTTGAKHSCMSAGLMALT
jgi:hypothetical protein